MENDVPADSEYESSSAYGISSFMDVDDNSNTGSALASAEHESSGSLKDQLPNYANTPTSDLLGDLNHPDNPTFLPHKVAFEAATSQNAKAPVKTPVISPKQSKGSHKVFDLFGDTKRRAAEASGKRKFNNDDEDGSTEKHEEKRKTQSKSHDKRPRNAPKLTSSRESTSGPVGLSNSAKASRSLNEQVTNGTFVKHPSKWERFVNTIKSIGSDAEFDIDGDPRKVRHSACTRSQKMDEPYNTSAFRKHANSCTGPTKAAQRNLPPRGSQTLFAMATSKGWEKQTPTNSSALPLVDLPCPGLNLSNMPPDLKNGLETYLMRTPLPGGGGPTVEEATELIFPKQEYKSLSNRQKNEVRSAQRLRYRWRNQADLQKVFSTTCCTTVRVQRTTVPVPACSACLSLLWDKAFKQALSMPLPLDDNRKYTPKALIDRAAVDRYAVISGLKDLIDANETVRNCCDCNLLLLTIGCRTHVFPVFVMRKASSMVIIKKEQTPFLHLWWRQWYQSTTKKHVALECKGFIMLLDS
jgi:hypothetical protein